MMRAVARGTAVTAVVSACALPSAAANVFVRVSAIWGGTVAGAGDYAMVATLTMTALIMAAVPFAIKKAGNRWEKLFYFAIGLGLATFNWAMAHDTMGVVRDQLASPVRQLQADAAALDARVSAATNSRTQLPQFKWTSAAMVTVAREAVASAELARAQECGKVGDNCRIRVGEKKVAVDNLAAMEADRALTGRAETLDAEISTATQARLKMGKIEEHADKGAFRLAEAASKWVNLGPDPETAMVDILVNVIAGAVEVIAWFGPRIILLAMMGDGAPAPARRPAAPVAAPAAVQKAAVPKGAATSAPQTTATPAFPKNASKNKAAGVRESKSRAGVRESDVREFGSVREWKNSRTTARADSRIKPADAYNAYFMWCGEKSLKPVTLTAFGTVMKGELGVAYEEKSKRGFYVGIALVGTPRLAASAVRFALTPAAVA